MHRRMPRVTISALSALAFAVPGADTASAAFTEERILGSGSGSAAGQLDGPVGIDVGPDGAVYVADSVNERVVKFDASGAFERTWGKDVAVGGGTGFEVCTTVCKAGVDGLGAGETQGVEDVAVSPDGLAVYVTDDGNRLVHQYAPDGTFVREWGGEGTDGGDLRRPQTITVAPSGDVYVTETLNERVSQFTGAGVFVRAFGVDVDDGGGTGYETCTVNCQAAASGDLAGIGVTSAGEVFVADSDEDRVGRFSAAGDFLGSFAGEGSGAGTVVNPQSVDVGAGDEVLVTQSADTSSVFRFSAGPVFLESFDPGPVFQDDPEDAVFGAGGATSVAYVSQRNRDRVVRYALGAAPVVPPVVNPAPAPAPSPAPTPAPAKPALATLPKVASVIVQPSAKQCVSRRNFRIRLKQPKGFTLKSATVSVDGRRVATRSGRRVTAPVDLRGLPKGRFTVKIAVTLTDGRKVTSSRRYRTCAPKRR